MAEEDRILNFYFLRSIDEDDNTILSKLVAKCGKDSDLPVILAIEALHAGFETTALAGSFLLYHMARNPEAQEKLYQEICEVIGPNGTLRESDLSRMKYTKACQMEAMRINPVAMGSMRKMDRDIVLGGYKVTPQGLKPHLDLFNFMTP